MFSHNKFIAFCIVSVIGVYSGANGAPTLSLGGHQGAVDATFYGERDVTGQMLIVTNGEAARFMFEQLGGRLGLEDLGLDGTTHVARVVADNVACFHTSGPLHAGSSLYLIAYFCQSQLNPTTGEMLPELYWHYRKIIPNGISVGN